MWRHKDVAWAIGETILMAFLGTMGAAIIALPLAFLAAKRFSPIMLVRAATRRLFDFVRGVDALIWTMVLARAFGPGPLTGALGDPDHRHRHLRQDLLRSAGERGRKADRRRASTGAKPLQRYRFGVIPQVMPVLLARSSISWNPTPARPRSSARSPAAASA